MNEQAAVDMKEVMERVQDDKELLMELFQIYLEDYVEKRKSLGEAVQKNDFEAVRNIAHGLKGASGNISAKKLHIVFLNLEQMGKNKDLSQASNQLKQVDTLFAELQSFTSQLKK